MAQTFNFAIVQLAPGGARNERLNVGAAVFREDALDVRLPKRLDKIRCISAAVDYVTLRALLVNFERLDQMSRADGIIDPKGRIAQLSNIGPIAFSAIGSFVANSAAEYENRLSLVMTSLIDPEPAPAKIISKRSRLLSLVKNSFRLERVLAKKDEDISSHRLVQNLQLAEGLVADLVLQNGAMHVIETVDVSADDLSARRVISDVAVSALVLEQARMNFGASRTKSKLVYDASASLERIARPSLEAAQHQGVELVNWASHDARRGFIVQISSLAIPFEDPKRKGIRFNSSTQSSFKLN